MTARHYFSHPTSPLISFGERGNKDCFGDFYDSLRTSSTVMCCTLMWTMYSSGNILFLNIALERGYRQNLQRPGIFDFGQIQQMSLLSSLWIRYEYALQSYCGHTVRVSAGLPDCSLRQKALGSTWDQAAELWSQLRLDAQKFPVDYMCCAHASRRQLRRKTGSWQRNSWCAK